LRFPGLAIIVLRMSLQRRSSLKAVFLDFATMGNGALDTTPLHEALPNLELFDTTRPEEISARIAGAEFVLANKSRLDAGTFGDAGSLRYIGLAATGTDNVDLAYAQANGIAVTNIRGYCTDSVVEHVFAVLLMLARSLGPYRAAVRQGRWQDARTFCLLDYPIRELSSMSIGIVGHGVLGGGVAQMAERLGMQVLIARRRGAAADDDGRVDLEEMLERADVVSLHCPLTPETRNLIGARELELMKRNAFLVNTARGGLVDSSALAEALASGRIAGAAIDVLPEEPPADGNPLLDYDGDNLVLTPHVAWASAEARRNAIRELGANVASFLAGERRNRVV
jgi:glycerate dehydrogenase